MRGSRTRGFFCLFGFSYVLFGLALNLGCKGSFDDHLRPDSDIDADPDSDLDSDPDADPDDAGEDADPEIDADSDDDADYEPLGIGVDPDFPLWDPPDTAVHIDPTNTSDISQDGTIDHPFDSFEPIVWANNTTYVIKRGTIIETDELRITASNVVLASYGDGDRPVIRSTATVIDGTVSNAISIENEIDITIRDLVIDAPDAESSVHFAGISSGQLTIINCVFRNSIWGVRALNSTDIFLLNTETHHHNHTGFYFESVDNIEVSHCWIHDVNLSWTPPETPEKNAPGDAIFLNTCNNWHVHHSILDRSNSGNKFCIMANNPSQNSGIIEYNELSGPLSTSQGGASLYFHDGADLIVRYNLIQGPFPFALYTHTENLQFYGNITVGPGPGVYASVSADIFNNTFYGVEYVARGGTIEARNNIIAFTEESQYAWDTINMLTQNHNLHSSGKVPEESFVGNPMFVDPEGLDFYLQSESDAIDRGTDVSLEFDRDGVPIPQGDGPDIGAYEFIQ